MTERTYRMIPADELTVLPWKNGGGVTTEVARGAARGADQDWSWRVSAADVGSTGPFSAFPGIDRTICVIEGEGMDLRFDDGRVVPLEPDQPVDFDGGDAVTGILREHAIRDFNVMVDRRFFTSDLKIVRGPDGYRIQSSIGGVMLVHMLDGNGVVTRTDGTTDTLGQRDSIVFEGEGEVSVKCEPGARAAVVCLEHRQEAPPVA